MSRILMLSSERLLSTRTVRKRMRTTTTTTLMRMTLMRMRTKMRTRMKMKMRMRTRMKMRMRMNTMRTMKMKMNTMRMTMMKMTMTNKRDSSVFAHFPHFCNTILPCYYLRYWVMVSLLPSWEGRITKQNDVL